MDARALGEGPLASRQCLMCIGAHPHEMAGTGWKAAGTILIVLGAVAFIFGVAAATFGGTHFAGAVEDASDCGGFLNPCNEESIEGRGEAGMAIAAAGAGLAVTGLVFAIIGIVLVFIGSSRARRAATPPTP